MSSLSILLYVFAVAIADAITVVAARTVRANTIHITLVITISITSTCM
jgi:hypothetical protein